MPVLAGCALSLAPVLAAGPAKGGDPARGRRAIVVEGCPACHAIPGIAQGRPANVGPPLKHIAKRAYIAGVLPNEPGALERWIMDPPGIDPRTAMPDLGIREPEARDIAAYLRTLE